MTEQEMKRRLLASSIAVLCLGSLYYVSALRFSTIWPSAVTIVAFAGLMVYARPAVSARIRLHNELKSRGLWTPPPPYWVIGPILVIAVMFFPLAINAWRDDPGKALPALTFAAWPLLPVLIIVQTVAGHRTLSREFGLLAADASKSETPYSSSSPTRSAASKS